MLRPRSVSGRAALGLVASVSFVGAFLVAGWGAPARAELGGGTSSISADGGRLGARMSATAMPGYTRHELTRPNTGSVRELTNAQGQVFAVTWSGPGKPDLRALLGPYFARYQAANGAARRLHSLRRPPQVSGSDLQIQTGGHMGWFHGVAFLPSLAPAGFALGQLSPGA